MNNDYDDLFQQAGSQYGIDPLLLKAQATYESGLDPNFKNKNSSASGLTAFTDATAKDYNVDRTDPKSSIDGQARYLLSNYQKFKDSPDPTSAALSAYKTGPNSDSQDPAYVNGVMQVYQDLKKNQPVANAPITGNTTPTTPEDKWAQKIQSYSNTSAASNNGGAGDLAYQGDVPKITVRPQGVPVQKASVNSDNSPESKWAAKVAQYNVPPETPANAPDNTPQGTYNKALDNAKIAVSGQGTSSIPGVENSQGVPAAELAYAANAESSIPGLHEAGSGIAAALGGIPGAQEAAQDMGMSLGKGNSIGQRYDNLEQAQQAMRQAGEEQNPDATTLGQVGAALATTPLFPSFGGGPGGSTAGKILGGAGTGAGYGALYGLGTGDASKDSTDSMNTRLTNAAHGAAFGGAFGAAVPAAVGLGRLGANALTRSATPDVVNATNALHELSGGPVTNLDTTEYIPGSRPTLAQAAAAGGDPKAGSLAALEQTLGESKSGSNELFDPSFQAQKIANDSARRASVMDMTGTPADITSLQKDRSASANELMGNEAKRLADPSLPPGTVWQDNKPTNLQPALDYIKAVRNSDASDVEGLNSRLDKIQQLLQSPKAERPGYVYQSIIKPQLKDFIEDTNPFNADSSKQSQLPFVKQLKSIIDGAVADAAPGYRPYLQDYATRSQAIERQQGLQSLGLVNPEVEDSYPTLAKVNQALKKVQAGRDNYDPTDSWKSLKPEDVNMLQNLQKDLSRQQAPSKVIATNNSATAPKGEFIKKVNNALGTNKSEWPRVAGSAVGSAVGQGAGSLLGLPEIIAGPMAAGGAVAGERVGKMVSDQMAARGTKTASGVTNLLLNPKDYEANQAVSRSGIANNLNPFNRNGATGKFFSGTNYAPGLGYGANKLLQLANPSGGS